MRRFIPIVSPMRPFVSVAIPSWRGEEFLGDAIHSVLRQPTADIELVVSVDKQDVASIAICKQFDDPRLKLIHPPHPVGMAAHYEFCLNHVTGEWVTILGQDDGLMPHFSTAFSSLVKDFPSARAFSFKRAYFYWPGCDSLYGKRGVQVTIGPQKRWVSGERKIQECLEGRAQHFDLPQLYTNGMIKHSTVKQIRSKSGGRFYHEMTPDVYSGFAIALAAHEYVDVSFPLFWTGTSASSLGFVLGLDADEVATHDQNNVKGHHLAAAYADGVGTSILIDQDLWLASDSTPIFAISSLDCCPIATEPLGRSVIETGLAGALALQFLSFIPLFEHRRHRLKVSKMLLDRGRDLDIPLYKILIRLPPLMLGQAISRLRYLWFTRLSPSTHSVSFPSGDFQSIRDINEWMEQNFDDDFWTHVVANDDSHRTLR